MYVHVPGDAGAGHGSVPSVTTIFRARVIIISPPGALFIRIIILRDSYYYLQHSALCPGPQDMHGSRVDAAARSNRQFKFVDTAMLNKFQPHDLQSAQTS